MDNPATICIPVGEYKLQFMTDTFLQRGCHGALIVFFVFVFLTQLGFKKIFGRGKPGITLHGF